MDFRTWYDPGLEEPTIRPERHPHLLRGEGEAPAGDSPWQMLRRRLGNALIRIGRFISPDTGRHVRRQAVSQR